MDNLNGDGHHIADLCVELFGHLARNHPEVFSDDPKTQYALREFYIYEPEEVEYHRCKNWQNNKYCHECQQDGRYACFKRS
jgi:hypothetical protein